MFASSKRKIVEVLMRNKSTFQASLYVPDTLVSYAWSNPTDPYLYRYGKDYLNYTGRQTHDVVLLVWQHLTRRSPCTLPEAFQCIGCDVSGTNRAKTEGKQYSDFNYQSAMRSAHNLLAHADIQLSIHNSGGHRFCDKISTSVVWFENEVQRQSIELARQLDPLKFTVLFAKNEQELRIQLDAQKPQCGGRRTRKRE